jgi:chaperonin GroEL
MEMENDAEIYPYIVEAFRIVGHSGVIKVKIADNGEIGLNIMNGIQFSSGYLSPYFVTDAENMEVLLEEVFVLLYRGKISTMKEMLPLLEDIASTGKPLLIVANSVEGEALSTLVINKLRGTLKCVAIQTPGYGHKQATMMEDLADLTGGRIIYKENGSGLEEATLNDLGKSKWIMIDKTTSTISVDIKEEDGSSFAIKRSVNNIALVKIDAASESKKKELKSRAESAIRKIREVSVEGMVPGGGASYLHACKALDKLQIEDKSEIVVKVVRNSLEEPIRQLVKNAGFNDDEIVEKVLKLTDSQGFDINKRRYVDMFEMGIVDSTTSTCEALQYAVALVSLMIAGQVLKLKEEKGKGEDEASWDDENNTDK